MFSKLINLFNLFDKKSKRKLFYTQILVILSAIFEILSIFSIGPLVQILSNPEIVNDKSQFISRVYFYLNFSTFESFLIFIVIIIFCFLFFSTIILSLTLYVINVTSQTLGNTLRINLFKFYILKEWIYHSRSNTSDYIEKIQFETNRVAQNIILGVLITNSKLITGIAIIIFLIIYSPIISIICIVLFALIYGAIFFLIRFKLSSYGKNQSIWMNNMYKIINEAFVGIKETIIYGNQAKYYNQFSKSGERFADVVAKINFLASVPRYILEFFAFTVILLFILIMTKSNSNNFNDSLPIISVFIFAGYKLLPIFQAIYNGFVQVKANLPAYQNIENELIESKKYIIQSQKKSNDILKLNDKESFLIKNVSFFYQVADKKAVIDIDIKFEKNSLNFIVGPSGSGKSTLIDLCLGLIFPQKGEIFVGKDKLNRDNAEKWHCNLGYVGQNIFLIDDTIKNNICLIEKDEIFDEKRFNNAINLSYVETFLKDMPDGINTIVGERGIKLSGGQRQRIAIARALYHDKSILILDEATASLDGIAERFISEQLKELSKTRTIIMVSHNIKLCRAADMIYLLDDGVINDFGTYDKLKKNDLFLRLLDE